MGGIFKAYDIRGSYPDELDETMAKKIGAAFVSLLTARRIVVGRDMRLSALALTKAFIEGAISSGARVKDIGMISLEDRTDDVFLRAIEIFPTHQGQGIGARIIQEIIDDAASKQKPVSLSVLKVNPAKSLYKRLGFSVIEETDPRIFMKTS